MSTSLQRHQPRQARSAHRVQAILAAVYAWVLLGEAMGTLQMIGAAVVLIISVAVYALLQLGVRLWLTQFDQGPFEMLLAMWTGPRPPDADRVT